MNYEETKESKELRPYELVKGQYYYLTVGSQNIQREKALFTETKRSKIGNTEYFFEINGHTVLDNMNYGLLDTSNSRYWHVYRIDPEYSYIAESEFNNLFMK